jgi:hypothetical protein
MRFSIRRERVEVLLRVQRLDVVARLLHVDEMSRDVFRMQLEMTMLAQQLLLLRSQPFVLATERVVV